MASKKKLPDEKLLAERLRPGLNEVERKFMAAAELGDDDVVKQLLESGTVGADITDTQGRTVLDIAIASDQESLVLYLIKKVSATSIHQGLLCAVENDRAEICEILLKHDIYKTSKTPDSASEMLSPTEIIVNPRAPERLRPPADDISTSSKTSQRQCHTLEHMLKEALIKASIKNNFQIVRMIILKGATLEMPHDYFCPCQECITEQEEDYMVFCNKRLDTFRALASPAYLALTEEDPVMASFRLSKKFNRLEVVETEYQNTYCELNAQVQEFTLDLLNECRTSSEVRSVLDAPISNEVPHSDDDKDSTFPLLAVALNMDQKKFVAHPKCQAQVSALWFSGLQSLRHLNRFEFLLMAIPIGMVVLPILSLVYVVAPWSKVTLLLNTPSTRFLSYTCSYISFLTLIIVGKLQFSNMWLSMGCDETEPFAYAFVALIFLWILGWIWEEMKQVFESGATDYFCSIWNVIDSLMLTFLLSSFTLDVVIPIRMSQAIKESPLSFNLSGEKIEISMIPTCYMLRDGFNYLSNEAVCSTSAVTVALFAEWTPTWAPDPELISDIMFSAGIILSIARISFIMPANETFGTMLVSFRRTFGDLIKLFAMFLLILVSFSCGLAALYAAHKCQTLHFYGFRSTMFLLIWSLFGFGPGEAPDLISDKPMSSLTNNPSRNTYTVGFGYIIYGLYVFAALVVLLNLLIAVMSNTFQEVQDTRDVEWKFARTELWMTFIEPGCPVAPPFNLIPTPKSICSSYWSLHSHVKSCVSKIPQRRTLPEAPARKISKKRSRQEVMCTLIRRYIEHAEREMTEGDENATEDKLRRLIERVSTKTDERLEEIKDHLKNIDEHVHIVHHGGKDIKTMQEAEIELTKKLIDTQEKYRKLMQDRWEAGSKFREERLREIQEMREHRKKLLEQNRILEAFEVEDKITDALEDAEFVPRTTIE